MDKKLIFLSMLFLSLNIFASDQKTIEEPRSLEERLLEHCNDRYFGRSSTEIVGVVMGKLSCFDLDGTDRYEEAVKLADAYVRDDCAKDSDTRGPVRVASSSSVLDVTEIDLRLFKDLTK